MLNILAVFLYTQFNYFIALVRVNINEDVIYRFGDCVHFEYLILFLKVCVLSVTVSVETRAYEPYRESLLNSLFLLFGWKLFKVTHVYIQSLLGKFDTVTCWCCNVLSFCYMHMLLLLIQIKYGIKEVIITALSFSFSCIHFHKLLFRSTTILEAPLG